MAAPFPSIQPDVRLKSGRSRAFLTRWALCSLAGGVVISLVDAALLQRSESYFTGGFLSTQHLSGWADVLSFLVVSLAGDAAAVGVGAALAMWLLAGLRPRAGAVAGFLAGTFPLLTADVFQYELTRYLGDALDLQLMFDLTGGSVREILAVSSGHLVAPIGLVALGATTCGAVVWLVNRYERGVPVASPSWPALFIPLAVVALSTALATLASAANERVQNGVVRKPAGQVMTFIADEVTDIDRDGFGIAGRLRDPDPRNSRVFPYALDVAGNGIDENGVGGDLPAGLEPYAETAVPAPWRRRPDVVIILLESFRFDLVGARYDGRPVTPVIDALAARGVSSRRAYSHNGYTAQSRFHLMTGSLAEIGDGKSLVDDFAANGYTTAWVSGQDESFGGPRYAAGFTHATIAVDARDDRDRRYSTFTTAGSLAVPFEVVQEHVADALRSRVPADKPLFLHINLHDTHFPYSRDGLSSLVSATRLPRHRIGPDQRGALWATYVNTAANVDKAIGGILDQVRRLRGREPAIIVTADHGESLYDDGLLGHGYSLDAVQTQVPLVVTNLPIVIEEPFGQRDLRDALNNALRTPEASGDVPRLAQSAGKEVFQYLGQLNRPRQIALRTLEGQVIYDFRTGRSQVDGGPWTAPDALPARDRSAFQRLVWSWEQMMAARAASSGSGD